MSRIGKKPIDVPEKVKIDIDVSSVKASGPLGNLSFDIPSGIRVVSKENQLFIEIVDKSVKNAGSLSGTCRARINNLVEGVSKGFEKTLEIKGLGYRSNVAGNKINLELGFSHPVSFDVPPGISAQADAKKNTLTIKGCDKALVGDIAARIRKIRPPEPYKGSGVRYLGEHVVRKAGKTASAGAKK
ncbi:MAG TPA: 50S ribosomal protein L6 [Elusimicrobiales bacterium]|nr:50S ribosomal protein L6 [Elusimicrobiales bacterium]